jgi:hypothetical protein
VDEEEPLLLVVFLALEVPGESAGEDDRSRVADDEAGLLSSFTDRCVLWCLAVLETAAHGKPPQRDVRLGAVDAAEQQDATPFINEEHLRAWSPARHDQHSR